MSKAICWKTIFTLLVSVCLTVASAQAEEGWFNVEAISENSHLDLWGWGDGPCVWETWAYSDIWEGDDSANTEVDMPVPNNVRVNGPMRLKVSGGADMNNVVLKGGAYLATGNMGAGSIQTLTLGSGSAFAASNFAGSIGNIGFDPDGAGQLKVAIGASGIETINAGSVNLTGGNVLVDISSLGTTISAVLASGYFNLGMLFGNGTELTNWTDLDLFSLVSGDETFNFIDGGELAAGWSWDSASAPKLVYSAPPQPSAVPEPATLALFGIGLAGLAVARRRKK